MNLFDEKIKEIRAGEAEVEHIKAEIARKREEFEKSLEADRFSLKKSEDKLTSLKYRGRVCVRAGDLVAELAKVAGVEMDDVEWDLWSDMHRWGHLSTKEMKEGLKEKCGCLHFHVKSTKLPFNEFAFGINQFVSYEDLQKVQANGKTLEESLTRVIRHDDLQGEDYTSLELVNQTDFVLKIGFEEFRKDNKAFHPMSVMEKAISNIVERQSQIQQDKSSSPKIEGKERDRG